MNTVNRQIERGMVLGISRGLYFHFAIYIGNDEVVAYTSEVSDTSSNNMVTKTKMSHFIKDEKEFFVLAFNDNYVQSKLRFFTGKWISDFSFKREYKIQSREECASRAESLVGKSGYNLLTNNLISF